MNIGLKNCQQSAQNNGGWHNGDCKHLKGKRQSAVRFLLKAWIGRILFCCRSWCVPDKDEEWYDNAHTRFGGDDVGEFLPVSWLEIICERAEYSNKKMFAVNFGKRQVKLVT